MNAIRRRVRAVAFAWLLCQVASLSAFVPEQCCIAHAAEAAAKEKAAACHEEAAPPAPKDGDACPLHQGRTTHDCCAITNACDGPGAQLLDCSRSSARSTSRSCHRRSSTPRPPSFRRRRRCSTGSPSPTLLHPKPRPACGSLRRSRVVSP